MVGPQDAVGDAGLVLDRDEQHALGAARLLTDEDDAGDLDMAAVADGGEVGAAGHAAPRQLLAHEGQRIRAKRELQRPIVLDHLAPIRQRPKQNLQVDQVLLGAGSSSLDRQRAEVKAAEVAQAATQANDKTAWLVAVAAGVSVDAVTLDREHQRAAVSAAPLPGATLVTYRALEDRVSQLAEGWQVSIVPPYGTLPVIHFADNVDSLDAAARHAVLLSAWAARRWNVPSLSIPGLLQGATPERPLLAQRRALAIATLLKARGEASGPAPASDQDVTLGLAKP